MRWFRASFQRNRWSTQRKVIRYRRAVLSSSCFSDPVGASDATGSTASRAHASHLDGASGLCCDKCTVREGHKRTHNGTERTAWLQRTRDAWTPRVFVVCALTGKCILDSGNYLYGPVMHCVDLSALGRIAVCSKSICNGLCAKDAHSEETFIRVARGELLAYIPRESKLGYCVYAPTGKGHEWLPALKKLHRRLTSECGRWVTVAGKLLVANAELTMAGYTASTMVSEETGATVQGVKRGGGRVVRLMSRIRDTTMRKIELKEFWRVFRAIHQRNMERRAQENACVAYPLWIFGSSIWVLRYSSFDRWIEVIDGAAGMASRIRPLARTEDQTRVSVDLCDARVIVGTDARTEDLTCITVFTVPMKQATPAKAARNVERAHRSGRPKRNSFPLDERLREGWFRQKDSSDTSSNATRHRSFEDLALSPITPAFAVLTPCLARKKAAARPLHSEHSTEPAASQPALTRPFAKRQSSSKHLSSGHALSKRCSRVLAGAHLSNSSARSLSELKPAEVRTTRVVSLPSLEFDDYFFRALGESGNIDNEGHDDEESKKPEPASEADVQASWEEPTSKGEAQVAPEEQTSETDERVSREEPTSEANVQVARKEPSSETDIQVAREERTSETDVLVAREKPTPGPDVQVACEETTSEADIQFDRAEPVSETKRPGAREEPTPESDVQAKRYKLVPETDVYTAREKPTMRTDAQVAYEQPTRETDLQEAYEQLTPETDVQEEYEQPTPEADLQVARKQLTSETDVQEVYEQPTPEPDLQVARVEPAPETDVLLASEQPMSETDVEVTREKPTPGPDAADNKRRFVRPHQMKVSTSDVIAEYGLVPTCPPASLPRLTRGAW